jgi:hypothetical protein
MSIFTDIMGLFFIAFGFYALFSDPTRDKADETNDIYIMQKMRAVCILLLCLMYYIFRLINLLE